MGLDITFYRKLDPAAAGADPENDYEHFVRFGSSMEWSEGVWPGRGAPLDSQTVYSFAEKGRFRAGSYGGYNSWRSALESMASGDDFAELINFADNEGVIGPIVSAKLAADFVRNQDRAIATNETHDVPWFLESYNNWRKAFETAADGGAMEFH